MNFCKNLSFLRFGHFCVCSRYFGMRSLTANTATIVSNRASKNAFTLEPLQHRELIRVHGADALTFLQGLVTNDLTRLQGPQGLSSIYALFLNRGGRVLYDSIVYSTNDPKTFLLECDRDAGPELRRHLRTFRVRKQIDIDNVDDEYVPWIIFHETRQTNLQDTPMAPELFVTVDPRLPALGTRVLAPTSMSMSRLVKGFWRNNELGVTSATPYCNYKLLRYKQGVAEGIEELPPGKCFPLEINADFLNGVSFSKGCYIGQELTARVRHSGVIRKRIMPILLTAPSKYPKKIKSLAGADMGRICGQIGDRALALLRIEQVLNGQHEMLADGARCHAEKPTWWPIDYTLKRRFVSRAE